MMALIRNTNRCIGIDCSENFIMVEYVGKINNSAKNVKMYEM